MSKPTGTNPLLENRKHLAPRESIQSIINFAKQQDRRHLIRFAINSRANLLLKTVVFAPLVAYTFYQFGFGYWRSIYPGNILGSMAQLPGGQPLDGYAPEIAAKLRERVVMDMLKASKAQ